MDTDRWGHPWIPENTGMYENPSAGVGRYCLHCRICQARARRAGITLEQYYKRNPEALPYNGFPVAGAKVGSPFDRMPQRR